ncbi:MAG: 50S ribosomal protein L31e [Methanoregula sp.]|jgi:large subunit ribosomal protein L31e|nr:50S ribosomal protein L31e [Methanoregula sp.]
MAEKLQEHIYIIPLRDTRRAPRWKRCNAAIKDIKKYLARHMKSEEVKLDKTINEKVWERGSTKPPSKIRIRAMKMEDGQVEAELAEES